MTKHKDYSIINNGAAVTNLDNYREAPWRQTWYKIEVNFHRWRYIGYPVLDENNQGKEVIYADRDEIVIALRNAIWEKKLVGKSKYGYCNSGISNFLQFLDNLHTAGECISHLKQIDKKLLERYIQWLRYTKVADTDTGRMSYMGAKNAYQAIKSPLQHLVAQQALPEGIFPNSPFPNSNRSSKGQSHYPKAVMAELLRVLGQDIRGIRNGSLKLSPSQTLSVYMLVIAARSGRNPNPLIRAPRDALKPHPVKPTTMGLLVLYKTRGNSSSVQAFQKNSIEVEDMISLPMDAMTLFHEVDRLTAPLVSHASPKDRNRLWLYRPRYGKNRGQVVTMTETMLLYCAQAIVKRHQLKGADREPLRLNIMSLRKTFNQRMWQLTDGDIIQTARLTGNTHQVNDRHYLAVTPEMESNHRRLGHVMHADLTGALHNKESLHALSMETGIVEAQLIHIANGDNNTGVGRCRDPKNGENAPL